MFGMTPTIKFSVNQIGEIIIEKKPLSKMDYAYCGLAYYVKIAWILKDSNRGQYEIMKSTLINGLKQFTFTLVFGDNETPFAPGSKYSVKAQIRRGIVTHFPMIPDSDIASSATALLTQICGESDIKMNSVIRSVLMDLIDPLDEMGASVNELLKIAAVLDNSFVRALQRQYK
jgi:hypothetical protein